MLDILGKEREKLNQTIARQEQQVDFLKSELAEAKLIFVQLEKKFRALQKTNEGWAFISEWQLEEFVWNNLQEIFGFHPLERQHYIKGEICDILAISNNDQLVIIELKNVEDRYVINQLTRYYDNLIEEKPFQEKLNYNKEILLFAICPIFHRHNLIDQKHSQLKFDLFRFSIVNKNEEFYFHLSQVDEKPKRWSTGKAQRRLFS